MCPAGEGGIRCSTDTSSARLIGAAQEQRFAWLSFVVRSSAVSLPSPSPAPRTRMLNPSVKFIAGVISSSCKSSVRPQGTGRRRISSCGASSVPQRTALAPSSPSAGDGAGMEMGIGGAPGGAPGGGGGAGGGGAPPPFSSSCSLFFLRRAGGQGRARVEVSLRYGALGARAASSVHQGRLPVGKTILESRFLHTRKDSGRAHLAAASSAASNAARRPAVSAFFAAA